jgi:hypothetical protein
VVESEFVDDVNILPLQTWDNVTTDEVVSFKRNIGTYTDVTPYPKKLAVVSDPATFRDLELVTVHLHLSNIILFNRG